MQVTCIKCNKHGTLSINQSKSNGRVYKYYGIQHYDLETRRRSWCYIGKYESLPEQYKAVIHKKQSLYTNYTQRSRVSEKPDLSSFYEKEGEKLVARRRFELLSWDPRPTFIHKIISKFIDYCRIDERLRPSVIHGYKYIARRFLLSSKGELSKDSIRTYLSKYLEGAPKTYNNQLDGLRAFIGRFLGHPELMNGFKKAHQTTTYEFNLPTLEQVRLGFEGLTDDREKAIYLMFLTSGLRKSELLDLTFSEIDLNTRSIKSRHDTRTKKAGVTFYNEECEKYLQRYLDSRTDNNEKLFRIGTRDYMRIWTKASKKANFKITAQVCRKWHSTILGELMVPDRYVDIFQGRAPKTVLAKHYTGKDFDRLHGLYSRIGLRILTPSISIFTSEINNAIQV